MRARLAVAVGQGRPALETIDGAIAGIDRLVERHQRLQRVDGFVLDGEHRLPALDGLPGVAELARIDRGQLAPQGRTARRRQQVDVPRALVGEGGEAPFGEIVIGERAPRRLVGLVLEQPLQRLDGAPALAELAPRGGERAMQLGARPHTVADADQRLEHLGALANAAEARVDPVEGAQRCRIAGQPIAQRRPALGGGGRSVDGIGERGGLAQRREVVVGERGALVEQAQQRAPVAALARELLEADARAVTLAVAVALAVDDAAQERLDVAGAAEGGEGVGLQQRRRQLLVGREGGDDVGEERLEIAPAIGARDEALEAGALLRRGAQAIGGSAHEKGAVVLRGPFVQRGRFDQQVGLRAGIARLFGATENLFYRCRHRCRPSCPGLKSKPPANLPPAKSFDNEPADRPWGGVGTATAAGGMHQAGFARRNFSRRSAII